MGTESEIMLSLASEAFQAKNFDLAAEIYECQLEAGAGDASSRQEWMVRRADALALSGRFTEAFSVYRQASEVERLKPSHLDNLVECLTCSKRRQDAGSPSLSTPSRFSVDISCRICLSFLFEPVTLPCGHCFCKKCLEREIKEKEKPLRCKVCGDSSPVADYRLNVVLSGLLAKWFPRLQQAGRLRREGNSLYAEKRMEAALEKYDQAILIAPLDHILFSNRSQIHSGLRHWNQALSDAETCCTLMPTWSKGHIRKAQALQSLGRSEEALREYLLCLSIEPDCSLARTEAHKLLSELLAPVTDQVPKNISDYTSLLSSRNHIKSTLNASQQFSVEASVLSAAVRPDRSKQVKTQVQLESSRLEQNFLLKRKRSCSDTDLEKTIEEHKRMKSDYPSSEVENIVDPADVECSLCMRLFFEPVTTPCGHTFCLQCLERCLDHNPKCPLCKEELSEYLVQRQYSKTLLMEQLIAHYLPLELTERNNIHQDEMDELSNLNKNVPIFVCTMAFPTVPCPLHIFEPCYRLMIRRAMETGTNRFGMCLGDNLKGFADYGCLLEIRDVKFFSDGRSVVDTIGRRRFKVVQHKERDGYNTADIEYLEDVKLEGDKEMELQKLHDSVYDLALVWVNSLKKEQKERIEGHFGPMPEKDPEIQSSNGPSWCWWLLAVLPLEGRAQLPFLALTSLKDRLSGIRKVLLFMSQSKHR